MEFLYPSAPPAYRGSNTQQSQAATSFPSGIVSYLFGGVPSSYKTVGNASASAPAPSRSWWQMWNATPAYKAAPPATESNASTPTPDDGDDGTTPDDCGDAQGMTTQVVIL